MAGEKLADLPPIDRDIAHIAVKEAVFPFARFPGVDPVLSPEMKSTGEVMGIDSDFATAFAQVAAGRGDDPADRRHLVRLGQGQRQAADPAGRCATLIELGFTIDRDRRHRRLSARRRGSRSSGSTRSRRAARTSSTGSRTARSTSIFNTTEGWQSHKDSPSIRASALMAQRALLHHRRRRASPSARAIAALRERGLEVRSLQDYYSASRA